MICSDSALLRASIGTNARTQQSVFDLSQSFALRRTRYRQSRQKASLSLSEIPVDRAPTQRFVAGVHRISTKTKSIGEQVLASDKFRNDRWIHYSCIYAVETV
jgi:hypothetical protein